MRLSRLIPAIGAAVVVLLLAMVAGRFLQAPAVATVATVTVESQPVVVSVATATDEPAPATAPTAPAAEASATTELTAEPTEAPTETATETAAPVLTTFRIIPEESMAEFRLDETLGGQRITVVGTTNQVNGEIVTDLANPATTQLSEISVNARTLATDNGNRNRAIANFILQTGQFEFITFRPTAINGLSGPVTVGQPTTFELVGDLTIRDQTRPATFQATVTPVSETRLEGTATTTILRADYGLQIPSVPNVADVEEEIELVLTFVAAP